jgi:hypothetical protein
VFQFGAHRRLHMEASHCAVRHVGPELGGRRGWRRACAVAAAAGVLGGAALSGLVSTKSLEAGTVAASVVGSSSADHPTPQLAAAAGRPSPPAVPKGWVATWDGLARRYYFYNQQTKETRSNHKPPKQSTHTHALASALHPRVTHTHSYTPTHTAGIFRRRRLRGKNPRSIRCCMRLRLRLRPIGRMRLRLRLRPIGRIAHTLPTRSPAAQRTYTVSTVTQTASSRTGALPQRRTATSITTCPRGVRCTRLLRGQLEVERDTGQMIRRTPRSLVRCRIRDCKLRSMKIMTSSTWRMALPSTNSSKTLLPGVTPRTPRAGTLHTTTG